MTYLAGRHTIVDENTNQSVEVGLFGGLKTTVPSTQLSVIFDKPLNQTHDVKVATTGNASINSMVNRSLLEVSSITTGDTAEIRTMDNAVYKTAATIETYFTASFIGTTVVGDTMHIGLFDGEDGVYLGYTGTDFVCAYRNINAIGTGNEPDTVAVIDMSNYDLSKIYRFRIRFGYLGVGNIYYEIFNGSNWDLLHSFVTDGTLADRTHIGSPALPLRAYIENSSTKSLKIHSGSWNVQTYSSPLDMGIDSKPFFIKGDSIVSVSAGQEKFLLAIRNNDTFGGFINKYQSEIAFAEMATNSEGLYRINFYKVPASTITTGTWVDVKVDESLISYNSDSTYNTFPLSEDIIFSTHLAVPTSGSSVASHYIDFGKIGLHLHPGDVLMITKECLVQGAGSDVTSWAIGYRDLF